MNTGNFTKYLMRQQDFINKLGIAPKYCFYLFEFIWVGTAERDAGTHKHFNTENDHIKHIYL